MKAMMTIRLIAVTLTALLTGGGHGVFWPFYVAAALALITWSLLAAAAVTSIVLRLRGELDVWWQMAAVVLVPSFPILWFWWIRYGMWMVF